MPMSSLINTMLSCVLSEVELTPQGRKRIAASNFALAGRRYPIHDISHARNALARVVQHGSADEIATVRRKVYAKYPVLSKKD